MCARCTETVLATRNQMAPVIWMRAGWTETVHPAHNWWDDPRQRMVKAVRPSGSVGPDSTSATTAWGGPS